jgi:hypothetical protein
MSAPRSKTKSLGVAEVFHSPTVRTLLIPVFRPYGLECNGTKQTVALPIWPGGEKNRIGAKISAARSVAANTKAPEPIDDDCLPVGGAHLGDKLAGSRIVGVDVTVTEVSSQ